MVTLHGVEELVERAGHLFTDVRREFLCATADPETWRALASFHRARLRPTRFTARKLSTSQVCADPEGRRQLAEAFEAGAQVRVAGGPLPQEAIVADRRIALLAGRGVRGRRSYTLVTAPDVVEGVHALLTSAWEASTEFTPGEDVPPPLDETARHTLRMLARGYTDERAAHRLGISVRTYRRRVAALMEALGATSRFQLGLRSARCTPARTEALPPASGRPTPGTEESPLPRG